MVLRYYKHYDNRKHDGRNSKVKVRSSWNGCYDLMQLGLSKYIMSMDSNYHYITVFFCIYVMGQFTLLIP